MKYLITGGTGFIGQALINTLCRDNHTVTVLSRHSHQQLPQCRFIKTLDLLDNAESFDVVINLAGSPINRRWSQAIKRDLIASRVDTTNAVVNTLARLSQPPAVMISASAIGYYGPQAQGELTENASYVDSFTHDICQAWEAAANPVTTIGTRLCITRLGVVLGKGGGIIQKMHLPFYLGLGGQLGSGSQVLSWIHIDDVIAGFLHLVQNPEHSGIYNFTAPNPVTNAQFTQSLGKALKRPTLLPLPSIIVRALFGEMGETLLLSGQTVLPQRLLQTQFAFTYPTLNSALTAIFLKS